MVQVPVLRLGKEYTPFSSVKIDVEKSIPSTVPFTYIFQFESLGSEPSWELFSLLSSHLYPLIEPGSPSGIGIATSLLPLIDLRRACPEEPGTKLDPNLLSVLKPVPSYKYPPQASAGDEL